MAPLSQFVAQYGCTADYLMASLNALREMTKRFSVEGPIRFFINDFPEETMAFLTDCAQDDNYHVRRLASEGTRPKLPWAQKLTIPYQHPLPILEMLYTDQTRYVTRSVANHLNDISKLEPQLVVETLKRWQGGSQMQLEKEMTYISRHALRTLIKQGNLDALALIGFGEAPEITITDFETSTPQVVIGEAFMFSLQIQAHKTQKLAIDYVMTFATDTNKNPQKVFKLKEVELEVDKAITINKKHPMRLMTTRRLVTGEHTITLQINGQPFGSLTFDLLEA
ncbi:MAG: DNA alkylation repair protein [Chloroflexota bacterium]